MEFGDVTAMSVGGHQATEAWLAGVKVWSSAPATTYYYPFRLVTNGNYMTLNEFTATSWDNIILNDANWLEQLVFTQNDVQHINDSNNNVIFVLSTTSSTYSAGGIVYLGNLNYEYTNALTQEPATRWSLESFMVAGVNDISGTSLAVDEVLLGISDGTYSYPTLMLSGQETISWEIKSVADSSIVFTGSNYMGPGSVSNIPWGNDTSTCSVPIQYWGGYMDLSYTLWSTVPNSSQPFTGTISVYIPDASGQGSVDVLAQAPDISDTQPF